MPKPCVLHRPSGLYVRFLLPADIQAATGTRFVMRALKGLRGDGARLLAAQVGYALARLIDEVRVRGVGTTMARDLKDVLDAAVSAAMRGDVRPYELSIPGVISLRADGPDDHNRAMEALAAMRIQLPPALAAVPPPAMPGGRLPAAPPNDPFSVGPRLHASIDVFLKQFATLGRAAATVLETRNTLTLFRDLTDDLPLTLLGSAEIDAFRDALAHWPVRAGVMPEFKGLSAREIVARGRELGGPQVQPRTLEKHLDRLRVFFNWAVQRQEMARNPLAGVRIQTPAGKYETTRRGFTPAELAVLFEPSHREKHCSTDPLRFWFPLLALFTGARVGELAQLKVGDLEAIAGVWGIHVTDDGAKRLKNRQSRRFVPLPARLMDLGFAAYRDDVAAQGFADLFPGVSWTARNGPADKPSKWFNRSYLRKVACLSDPELCLQSFRHTFITHGDRAGLTETQVGQLTGHAARSIQSKHYILKATLPERKARVELIASTFELPLLAAYKKGNFTDLFSILNVKNNFSKSRKILSPKHSALTKL